MSLSISVSLFLWCAALLLTLLAPLLMVLSAAPRSTAPMLVIVPPWRDAALVIAAAGGAVIGPQRAPFASLAQSRDPGFPGRAHRFGAWAVRDGARLATLCGVPR